MKKIVLFTLCLIIGIMIYHKNEEIIIPRDAIRIRIIANSNNINDLYKKKKLKNEIMNEINTLVKDSSNILEARDNINNNLSFIDKLVGSKTNDYHIKYGMNYFPRKSYKGIVYKEGEYESLVITLGQGLGDNWWCVLYPPLCLIDDITDDIQYRSLVYDILQN